MTKVVEKSKIPILDKQPEAEYLGGVMVNPIMRFDSRKTHRVSLFPRLFNGLGMEGESPQVYLCVPAVNHTWPVFVLTGQFVPQSKHKGI